MKRISGTVFEIAEVTAKILNSLYQYDVVFFHGKIKEIGKDMYLLTHTNGKKWVLVSGEHSKLYNDKESYIIEATAFIFGDNIKWSQGGARQLNNKKRDNDFGKAIVQVLLSKGED